MGVSAKPASVPQDVTDGTDPAAVLREALDEYRRHIIGQALLGRGLLTVALGGLAALLAVVGDHVWPGGTACSTSPPPG